MKRSLAGMTLIEVMIAISIFSLVMFLAAQSIVRGMATWGTSVQETTANFNLQTILNNLFQDALKAKASTVQTGTVSIDGKNYSTLRLQMPVQYTQIGADGEVGNYILYTVKKVSNQLGVYRQRFNSSDVLQRDRALAFGIDSNTDTRKTGTNSWKQKGFALNWDAANKELTIYLRVRIEGSNPRTRELETKVLIRN